MINVTLHIGGQSLLAELDDDALAAIAAALGSEASPADPWPEWMSVPTAARYLDVTQERVRKLKERHEIPYAREAPKCRVFFNRGDLDRWMQNQVVRRS